MSSKIKYRYFTCDCPGTKTIWRFSGERWENCETMLGGKWEPWEMTIEKLDVPHFYEYTPDFAEEPAKPRWGQERLRILVDLAWNEATQSTEVPSTSWADKIIDRALKAEENDYLRYSEQRVDPPSKPSIDRTLGEIVAAGESILLSNEQGNELARYIDALEEFVENIFEAAQPIVKFVGVNDSDTLARLRRDEEIISTASGSWSKPEDIKLGDLRKIAKIINAAENGDT